MRPDTPLGRDLVLFEITLRDERKDIAKELRARGMKVLASKLEGRQDAIDIMNNLAKGFLAIAKDNVPTDIEHIKRHKLPFELQAEHIQIEEASPGSPYARVYVDTEGHLGARRTKPIEAAGLAHYLNKVDQGRSMGSGSSKDWIIDSQLNWNKVKSKLLRLGRR